MSTDEHHEQPAQHVQLRMQVDDHGAGVASSVQQVVHGRERLDRPLERADGESRAACEHECRAGRGAPRGARDEPEQEPERGEHRDPGTMSRNGWIAVRSPPARG